MLRKGPSCTMAVPPGEQLGANNPQCCKQLLLLTLLFEMWPAMAAVVLPLHQKCHGHRWQHHYAKDQPGKLGIIVSDSNQTLKGIKEDTAPCSPPRCGPQGPGPTEKKGNLTDSTKHKEPVSPVQHQFNSPVSAHRKGTIHIQVICGSDSTNCLPKQTSTHRETNPGELQLLLSLPENIHCYSLIIIPGTKCCSHFTDFNPPQGCGGLQLIRLIETARSLPTTK